MSEVMSDVMSQDELVFAGQAVYSRAALAGYDFVALRFNSSILWRCPMRRLVAHYSENVSGRHLDIGVGTGRFMDACRFPVNSPKITLMDPNPNCLAAASRHLRRYEPTVHRASVLEPFGLPAHSFDSIGLNYMIHCLPGNIVSKAVIFDHCRAVLAPGGVVFGCTVLNGGVSHTALSRRIMGRLNRKRIFTNLEDDLDGFERALSRHFSSHKIEVVGAVAIFTAHA